MNGLDDSWGAPLVLTSLSDIGMINVTMDREILLFSRADIRPHLVESLQHLAMFSVAVIKILSDMEHLDGLCRRGGDGFQERWLQSIGSIAS